jgi:hypothetical protein
METVMISELVMFALPDGLTRDEVVEGMRDVAPHWRANPDLVRKTFLYDAEAGQAGALYLWPDRQSAERAHDEAWRARIRARYGSDPVIRYFETPLVVDNALGAILDTERSADAAT